MTSDPAARLTVTYRRHGTAHTVLLLAFMSIRSRRLATHAGVTAFVLAAS